MRKSKTKSDGKGGRQMQRVSARLGNCNAKTSAVRPVASSYPTFIIGQTGDPLGFPGLADRGGISGL